MDFGEFLPVLISRATELAQRVLVGGAVFALAGAVALAARRAVRGLLKRTPLVAPVSRLTSQTTFYVCLIIGFVSALGTMGIDVSALVASLGLGGFDLGFALRDAISNLLAGILILYLPSLSGGRPGQSGNGGRRSP